VQLVISDNDEAKKVVLRGLGAPRGAKKHFAVLLRGQVNVEVLLVDSSIVARSTVVLLGFNVGGPETGVPADLAWSKGA
jgi:hypothetical protein